MPSLQVGLGHRSYPIRIDSGLLANAVECLRPYLTGHQVMLVSNETVAPLYLEPLVAQLEKAGDWQISRLVLPDGEQYKTLAVVSQIYDALLEKRYSRNATLIAVGGGVIGDMVGFAAATYQRGIPFIQVPTTLLSQVDSSVGGKTGVNHPAGKNMIGAFHQPGCVLIDVDTLRTLPEREFSAGLAEVIKYGLIADADFFDWLESNMTALRSRDSAALTEAIARSCECKARIVAEDEFETLGLRALLNLGHTFGHAIETAQGYGQWLHGEAVAAGMLLAARLSVSVAGFPLADVERVQVLLQQAGLPVLPPAGMGAEDFLRHMAVDKKNVDGRLRLILLRQVGDAFVTDVVQAAAIRALFAAH